MTTNPNDIIKEAIANATAKTLAAGKALPEALKVPTPKEVKEVPRKPGYLWPVEPEQIAAWKAEDAAKAEVSKLFIEQLESPLALEATAASGRAAAEKKMALSPYRERVVDSEKAAPEPKISSKKLPKEGRQNRLGQTKLIDDLLRAGKSEAEIIAEVTAKIPAYPADKIPKMIKLRQYHIKPK